MGLFLLHFADESFWASTRWVGYKVRNSNRSSSGEKISHMTMKKLNKWTNCVKCRTFSLRIVLVLRFSHIFKASTFCRIGKRNMWNTNCLNTYGYLKWLLKMCNPLLCILFINPSSGIKILGSLNNPLIMEFLEVHLPRDSASGRNATLMNATWRGNFGRLSKMVMS